MTHDHRRHTHLFVFGGNARWDGLRDGANVSHRLIVVGGDGSTVRGHPNQAAQAHCSARRFGGCCAGGPCGAPCSTLSTLTHVRGPCPCPPTPEEGRSLQSADRRGEFQWREGYAKKLTRRPDQ